MLKNYEIKELKERTEAKEKSLVRKIKKLSKAKSKEMLNYCDILIKELEYIKIEKVLYN